MEDDKLWPLVELLARVAYEAIQRGDFEESRSVPDQRPAQEDIPEQRPAA